MFDLKEVVVKGGWGGNGAVSFLRERAKPYGGPDGGDGGAGGDVVLVAQSNFRTLGHLARVRMVNAADGQNGRKRDQTGRRGSDKRIGVPVGTVVWELDAEGGRQQLADLDFDGAEFVAARGGIPGRGNHRFSTPTNQEPLLAEAGEEGEERRLLLEVKLLADVAIVGAPNAGKSTLLTAVSNARPKIADYPFTTIEPVLGVVEHRGRILVLLDVPGLVEGASAGKGLGLEFLRHAERVQVLVLLVDGSENDPVDAYRRIASELDAYPGGLAAKPVVPVLNKVDMPEVQARVGELLALVETASGRQPMAISAATGENVGQLLDELLQLVPEKVEREAPPTPAVVPERPRPTERVRVSMDDEVYVVSSRQAERFIPMVDLNNWRARLQFHHQLERLGVIEALERKGVEPGDTVRIGSYELEWQ
ncbi:MAG: GTPase ObgE [Dehalococcoidia bacterium]